MIIEQDILTPQPTKPKPTAKRRRDKISFNYDVGNRRITFADNNPSDMMSITMPRSTGMKKLLCDICKIEKTVPTILYVENYSCCSFVCVDNIERMKEFICTVCKTSCNKSRSVKFGVEQNYFCSSKCQNIQIFNKTGYKPPT